MPEDQPTRVLVDVFDRLVQLGQGAAAVGGEGLEFLEARVGELRKSGRDIVGVLVEVISKTPDRIGGAADLAVAVAATGQVLQALHHLVEARRVVGQRRGHGLDIA